MERKKIVILDGFAANPGDLSWGEIEAMGDCSVYVRCDSEQEIVERASDAEIILTNKSVISRRVMEQLPKLKYIAVQATGYNVVDIQAAQERDSGQQCAGIQYGLRGAAYICADPGTDEPRGKIC